MPRQRQEEWQKPVAGTSKKLSGGEKRRRKKMEEGVAKQRGNPLDKFLVKRCRTDGDKTDGADEASTVSPNGSDDFSQELPGDGCQPVHQPISEASQPVCEASQPVCEASQPVFQPSQPVFEASKSAVEARQRAPDVDEPAFHVSLVKLM